MFLQNCQIETNPTEIMAYATSPENAERLWALSEELVGEKFCI